MVRDSPVAKSTRWILPPIGTTSDCPSGVKSYARQRVAARARLLIVARDRVNQPPFCPGVEIAHAEPGLRLVARAVHEPFAVRRNHRAHRRAARVRDLRRVARLAVVAVDLPQRKLRVVGEGTVALRVVDEAAVGRDRRAHLVRRWRRRWTLRVGAGRRRRRGTDAHAGAAVAVIHEQAEGSGLWRA